MAALCGPPAGGAVAATPGGHSLHPPDIFTFFNLAWEPRNVVQAEPWAMPKPSSRKTEPDDSLLLEPSLIALRKALAGARGAREQPVPLHDTPQLAAALQLARQPVEDKIDAPAVQLIGAGAPAGRG